MVIKAVVNIVIKIFSISVPISFCGRKHSEKWNSLRPTPKLVSDAVMESDPSLKSMETFKLRVLIRRPRVGSNANRILDRRRVHINATSLTKHHFRRKGRRDPDFPQIQ